MNKNYNNTQNDFLRVMLDVSRHLNAIERSSKNTENKVNQMHVVLMSNLNGGNYRGNNGNSGNSRTPSSVLRRSLRIKARTNKNTKITKK